jgi:cytochrome c oxidase cbb3-type subunit 3
MSFGDTFTVLLLVVAAVVILYALGTIYSLLKDMMRIQQIRIYEEQGMEAYKEVVEKEATESWLSRQYKKWAGAVPIEREEDVLFDHEFDGIRELDNKLPPWWVAMFYITIAFAVVYLGYYHLGSGASQAEEYEMEMEQAERAVAEYRARQAEQVDETNVTVVTDDQALSMAKTLYETNCMACHGMQGEGTVGPNLTDPYWIHGGSINDIFKTIKYGVPEKGMISWKTQLRATDMQNIASYILTLQGTNPPNGKAPEGELYVPAADSDKGSPEEETPEDASLGMLE